MRFFVATSALFISVALAAPQSSTLEPRGLSINPPLSAVKNSLVSARSDAGPRESNAKRLAAGLPPLAPRNLGSSGTQPMSPRTSSSPCWFPGVIAVKINGAASGYLSSTLNVFGEITSSTVSSANDPSVLKVCATLGSPELSIINPQVSGLPFLGGITGFSNTDDNLGPGSSNYLYLGQVQHTSTGSHPDDGGSNSFTKATELSVSVESGIWVINVFDNNSISLWWTNTRGLPFETSIVYDSADGIFLATGDSKALANAFQISLSSVKFAFHSL